MRVIDETHESYNLYEQMKLAFVHYNIEEIELISDYMKQTNNPDMHRFTTINGIDEQIKAFNNDSGWVFYLTAYCNESPKRVKLNHVVLKSRSI